MNDSGFMTVAEAVRVRPVSEDALFELGTSGTLSFYVRVPGLGMCRVPVAALDSFRCGLDEYSAHAMPQLEGGKLSGEWLVKRDQLRLERDPDRDIARLVSEALNPPALQPEPQAGPVVAEAASGAPAGPLPLTTGDIAFCFAGLRWSEKAWKKPLGNKPKWLQTCIVIPGQRGVSEARWNPVLIGAALVRDGHIKANSMRARFQTNQPLAPWLDTWKTYEADHLDTD